jgi:hypothetical protein
MGRVPIVPLLTVLEDWGVAEEVGPVPTPADALTCAGVGPGDVVLGGVVLGGVVLGGAGLVGAGLVGAGLVGAGLVGAGLGGIGPCGDGVGFTPGSGFDAHGGLGFETPLCTLPDVLLDPGALDVPLPAALPPCLPPLALLDDPSEKA